MRELKDTAMSSRRRTAPYLIAQLTDLHVRVDEGERESVERVEVAVRAVLATAPRPVGVLLTGDLVHTGERAEYELLDTLLKPLRDAGHVLLPVVGNHDDRASIRGLFPGLSAVDEIGEARHLQYVALVEGFRIIVLDTQRVGSDAGKICDARFAALQSALERDRETPTIIAMHHPPGEVALPSFDEIGLPPEHQARLRALLADSPNIERVVHGHVHRTITSACAGVPVFGCPSVGLPARPDFEAGVPIAIVPGPVGMALHVRGSAGDLVSHARMFPPQLA